MKIYCRRDEQAEHILFLLPLQIGNIEVEVSLRSPWPPGSNITEASTGTNSVLRRRSETGDKVAKAGRRLTVLNMEQLGFLADDDEDEQ